MPGAVSGLKDLKASCRSSSEGMLPLCGPVEWPKGLVSPGGCLSRRDSTTASSTCATALVPSRIRAAEPRRPSSTCLTAVGALLIPPAFVLASGSGHSTLGYFSSRCFSPLPRWRPGTSPTFGRASRSSSVSSVGFETKVSASLEAVEQKSEACEGARGLKAVGSAASDWKRC